MSSREHSNLYDLSEKIISEKEYVKELSEKNKVLQSEQITKLLEQIKKSLEDKSDKELSVGIDTEYINDIIKLKSCKDPVSEKNISKSAISEKNPAKISEKILSESINDLPNNLSFDVPSESNKSKSELDNGIKKYRFS